MALWIVKFWRIKKKLLSCRPIDWIDWMIMMTKKKKKPVKVFIILFLFRQTARIQANMYSALNPRTN